MFQKKKKIHFFLSHLPFFCNLQVSVGAFMLTVVSTDTMKVILSSIVR